MKIVINGDFGGYGFGVAEEFEDFVGMFSDDRTNSNLIEFVESHPHECGDLVVAVIPDTATDWEIDEYDGSESVTYVVDGKIYHAC
jgi:beta-glucanase (GH16 family)